MEVETIIENEVTQTKPRPGNMNIACFLSYVDASLDSLDICISFGILKRSQVTTKGLWARRGSFKGGNIDCSAIKGEGNNRTGSV